MDNIRVIVALYNELYFMCMVMFPILLNADITKQNTSFEFQRLFSHVKDLLYASYQGAEHDFYEMQENNPDWEDALSFGDSRTVFDLIDELKKIVMVYSEQKKFLDMLNYLLCAAKKEPNINPYFFNNIRLLQENMTNSCWNSLQAYHEKKEDLERLKAFSQKHFSHELLYSVKDMDALEYLCDRM